MHGHHDLINEYIGLLDSPSFERITRRVLCEFAKSLYAAPLPTNLFLFQVSVEQLVRFDAVISENALSENQSESTLTELEIGYRGLEAIYNVDRWHFAVTGLSAPEQSYDYELWLYVYFTGLYSLVR
jgi:hypothetical protein